MNKTKVLIAGASGLIGQALIKHLEMRGFEVMPLMRVEHEQEPFWNIEQGLIDLKSFQDPDVVINLCGENIAQGRWTDAKKQRLISSRINSTRLLTTYFSEKANIPSLFINASAIGFYGNQEGEPITEDAIKGYDFISKLASDWEQACQLIENSPIRLVKIRTGVVLSTKGGALPKMLPAFKFGIGGRVGSGKQIMSWIDIKDTCNAIEFIIKNQRLTGAVNITAPTPVSNEQFSKALAKAVHRLCLLPIPEFVIKIVFAEKGKELLLSSCNVLPEKLLKAGFKFEFETIEECLQKM